VACLQLISAHSADQECASGFFPLSTLLGFFLPVALLVACSLLVGACVLLIAPFYGRSLVTYLTYLCTPHTGTAAQSGAGLELQI
jgi:hypothetical protein